MKTIRFPRTAQEGFRRPFKRREAPERLERLPQMTRDERETSKKARDRMRTILSEDEVRLMTRRLRKVMGSILGELSSQYGLDIENSVRFGAVATRLREAREARGMDFKAVAKVLRLPQYRLRDIEQCRMKHSRASDLHAYIDLLGLNKWFARWSRANPKLAARLALKAAG